MKKIAPGYYETTIEGRKVEVNKIEEVDASTRNKWIWHIDGVSAEDWFPSKAVALEAAKEAIKENLV